MNESEPQRKATPWWLWPNVLNLDAPIVAVVWQEMFARVVGAQLGAEHRWLLFLAVWQIYLVDRWLDSRRDPEIRTDRHRFHRRVGAAGWVVEAAALVSSLALAVRCLNADGWMGAAALLALSGICFAMTHLGKSSWHLVFPKELWVGVVFASGCALQPWALAADRPEWFPVGVVMFAALCFFNCAAITLWERQPADCENPRSLLNRWPGFMRLFPVVCWGHILPALGVAMLEPGNRLLLGLCLALVLSLMGLAILSCLHSVGRARVLCVLVDAVMLTPLLALFVL